MTSVNQQSTPSPAQLESAEHRHRLPVPLSSLTRRREPTPFVKWAGGKRALVNELIARLPSTFATYIEPFAGGAALFFTAQDRIEKALLCDSNLELVVAYNVVKREPERLLVLLAEHARLHTAQYYYRIRRQRDIQDPVRMAARFIYLNKTCYNGLYRVNKSGQFNVPIGRYNAPSIYDPDNIMACHQALQKTRIEYRDFETIRTEAGDFVYCDPPYHPIANTASFTKYTSEDFSEGDQIRLRDFALRLHGAGVHVMISNSDTPLVRHLYSHPAFRLSTVQAPRLVNSKASKRGLIDELLITTYS